MSYSAQYEKNVSTLNQILGREPRSAELDAAHPRYSVGDHALLDILSMVRELHAPSENEFPDDEDMDYEPYCISCEDRTRHDVHRWPCPTARLVYSKAEIERLTG